MGETQDSGADDPLGLDAEAMRALGYRTVDMLVARLTDPADSAVAPGDPRRDARAPVRPAAAGRPRLRGDHRAARARRPALHEPRRPPGLLRLRPVLRHLARRARRLRGERLQRLRRLVDGVGRPDAARAGGPELVQGVDRLSRRTRAASSSGGGSAANLTALACARETLVGSMSTDVVGYVSDQAHSSIGRAARVLGFRPEQLRVLPHDAGFRLDPRTLAAAMDADLRAGRRPLFVAATAGTTNTGAIDPLGELGRSVPGARGLAARRRRLRRLRGAHRARPRGARGHRAGRLGDARPAQVALPALRVRRPARARRPHPARRRFR